MQLKSYKNFVNLFREKIDRLLDEKTSWGRNDLKSHLEILYQDVIFEVLENDLKS